MELRTLIDTPSFSGASSALGRTVTAVRPGGFQREPLGVIVDVKHGDAGVWVRRFTDEADVSVWYAVRDLELASTEDLVSIARTMLNWQYREVIDLRARVKANA